VPSTDAPAVTEPTTERFAALVVFRNGSSESRSGTLAVVTEWLGIHNPGIVESATIRLEVAKPQAATKPQADVKAGVKAATRAPVTKPATYAVKTDAVPDTAAGRRLAALRAKAAAKAA
jgi:hypothetical protein